MYVTSDKDFLILALHLAQQRKGYTSPNPSVGAVVVKDGSILGNGFHWGAGFPHAEVEALKGLEEKASGATLYVTLEPCCHFGRTPPCTDLLKRKKIKRVVYGALDPNPIVSGNGAKELVEAGIQSDFLPLDEIADFYRAYFYWVREGAAWLTGKLALSKNECISAQDGSPIKITGEQANEFTHFRRNQADVILTSIHTVLKDNPQFNVRLGDVVRKKPVWILDRQLKFNPSSKVFSSAASVTVLHGHTVSPNSRKKIEEAGVECFELSEKDQLLELSMLARELGRRGYHEAWCEVGAQLFSSFVDRKLFQEIVLYRSAQVNIENGKKGFPKNKMAFEQNYRKEEDVGLGPDTRERWFVR